MSNWSFIDHVSKYISRPRMGNEKEPTLWPSESSAIVKNDYNEEVNIGRCRRSIFFRFLLASYKYYEKYSHYSELVKELKTNKVDPDTYTQFIWMQGNLYEDYLLDIAKKSGVYIADQTQVYIPSHKISGKIDIVVIDPESEKYRIVEAKSVYGFNASKVLGSPTERKSGQLGTPKASYLMQLGLYQWWYANKREEFGDGLLVCGARDTGKYAEFGVTVHLNEETEENHIYYYNNDPYKGPEIDSGISIENILNQFAYIQECLDTGVIPERDFDLLYSNEKIDLIYSRGELNKSETLRYEKRQAQIKANKTKINKQIEKGDWQCSYCSFKNTCYSSDSTPKTISI